MKLVHKDFQIPYDFRNTLTLSIEDNDKYYEYSKDIVDQSNGLDGDFIILDNDERLNIKKDVNVIKDIFNISLNDKKVLSNLYQNIISSINEKYQLKYHECISGIYSIIDEINITSEINYEYDELGLMDLLKTLKVEIENKSETLLENIITYLRVIKALTSYKLIVFIGIRNFINKNDLNELLKEIYYLELNALFIENKCVTINKETTLIIDKDLCEIYINNDY